VVVVVAGAVVVVCSVVVVLVCANANGAMAAQANPMMILFMIPPFRFVIVSSTKLARKLFDPSSPRTSPSDRRYRGGNAAALDRGEASGEFLAQTALDTVRDRMDHVIVDLVGNFAGEMRRSVGHSLTRKRGSVLGAEERRAHGSRENGCKSFHLSSLLSI